jgi:hypothetical protein
MAALVAFQVLLTVGNDPAVPPAAGAVAEQPAADLPGDAPPPLALSPGEPTLGRPRYGRSPPLAPGLEDRSTSAPGDDGASAPQAGAAPDSAPAAAPEPGADPGWLALDEAYRRKAAGDLAGARRAFASVAARRAAPQRSALERAWIARSLGQRDEALRLLREAAAGRDARLAALAREDLLALAPPPVLAPEGASAPGTVPEVPGAGAGADARPARSRRLSFDLYADTFASRRVDGPPRSDLVVPTFRLRALWRPFAARDVHLYAFTEVSRELGDIALQSGAPVLHSDDAAVAGGGVLWTLWAGRAGLFAQAGAATHTAPGRAGKTELDVRGGAYLGLESARCWPAPARGLRFRVDPCADLYGEAVYLSRFRNDVEGLLRARAGATFLEAGPVALGLAAEARAAADRNGDWYDNFHEVGAGIRARLLAPFRVDLSATATLGRTSGRAGIDPAPAERRYLDLRLGAATYLEF